MRLTTGEVELFVAVDGDPDAPPIVLLHGIANTHQTWDWLVPDLRDRWRVIRPDFRGHGRSGRTPGGYTPAGYLADALAVVEQVASQPAVVVGHSLGGLTAAGLAQHRPQLVRAVVLEDPPLYIAAPTTTHPQGNQGIVAEFVRMRQATREVQSGHTAEDGVDPSRFHADAVQGWAHSQRQLDPGVLDAVIAGWPVTPFDATVPIPVPGLLLAGDPAVTGTLMTVEWCRRLALSSPGVLQRRLPGAGHDMHDEVANRRAVRDHLLDYLRLIESAA